ncbi:class 1 fructose-bisphosphatase [Roseibium aggregatum]|uniref:Fructose-1,6-bisphosphatase class 1 n=1 Tax=Roseibium aggregatum TaxID=187304 RepID=A0A939EIC7_9HYPH|nr:class 1 fructose-bisphosphatase [Roseibium aggregatum]MBN9672967.1 class 1 fructose-bisphosphatase [Roseibium aggregatum]
MTATQLAIQPDKIPEDFFAVLDALCRVAGELSRTIAMGPLAGGLGAEVGQNTDGDTQKALDVQADDAFRLALKGAGVRWYASEEQDEILEIDPAGGFALAIDPLDGSSNIDVNVSIGTIVSVFDAKATAEASFLRPAKEQLAAAYFIYGPQTALILTFGSGVLYFVLDPVERVFRLANAHLAIPETASEFAINASNYRHWSKPVRAYIDDCLAGIEGPRAKNFNMRWVASLVAETHRILTRGGIFLYPGDSRPGYENGRLRMVYECAPIAFLVEQAGGKATTGTERLLDQTARELHQRTPFVFGSADKVDRVAVYHDLPDQEVSALFGSRGLFRA